MMDPMNDKYNSVWKILTNYSFNINPSNNRDLTCVICNKILINAYQNECGCRFCYECIRSYLEINDKPCPGKTDECSEEIIDMKNIQADYSANKRLSAIPVKCPIVNCSYIDCLINIEDHLQSHIVDCPFVCFGCCHPKDIIENINIHINKEKYTHPKLILEFINNIRNNIEKSQRIDKNSLGKQFIELFESEDKKVEQLQLENEEIRQKLRDLSKNDVKNNFQIELDKMKQYFKDVIVQSNETNRNLEREIHVLKCDFETERGKNKTNNELMMGKFSDFETELDKRKTENELIIRKFCDEYKSEMKKSMNELKKDIETLNTDVRIFRKQNNSSTQSIIPMSYQINKSKESSIFERSSGKSFTQHIPSNSRKIHENYKIKYEIICEQMNDLRKDMKNILRDNKDFKGKLSGLQIKTDKSSTNNSSNQSEDLVQINKLIEKCQAKINEEIINNENISEEFKKLKKDLKYYLLDPDDSQGKIKRINTELTDLKQENKNLKYQIEWYSKEHRDSIWKLSSEVDDIKIKNENINSPLSKLQSQYKSLDKVVYGMEKNLEKCTNEIKSMTVHDLVINTEVKEIKVQTESFHEINESLRRLVDSFNVDLMKVKEDLFEFRKYHESEKSKENHQFCKQEIEILKDQQLKLNDFCQRNRFEIEKIDQFNKTTNEEIEKVKSDYKIFQAHMVESFLEVDLASKNLLSEIDNLKINLDINRSIDEQLQVEISNKNSEIAELSNLINNNQFISNKLLKDIEEIDLFRNNLETFQNFSDNIAREIKKNCEDVKNLKLSQEKLTEEIGKINRDLENYDKINQEINSLIDLQISNNENKSYPKSIKDEMDNIQAENQKIINGKFSQLQTTLENNFLQLNESNNNLIGQFEMLDNLSIKIRDELKKSMEEWENIYCGKINKLKSELNEDIDKRQIELKKEFKNLSKLFLNLKTECLNIKADITTQIAMKKSTNLTRQWTVEYFSRKFKRAKDGIQLNETSDWFHFAGYKMSFTIYPNGDSFGENKFMSVFFFIVKLKDLVEEQKRYRLNITLVCQNDESKSLMREYDYYNYIKTERTLDGDSSKEELGASDFISLEDLFENSRFIYNDSILFRFIVKPS